MWLIGGRVQDHSLVLEECPFCHKFLAAELLSKEEIDTTEALKEKDAFFKMGITIETGERIADHPDAFITSRLRTGAETAERSGQSSAFERSGFLGNILRMRRRRRTM